MATLQFNGSSHYVGGVGQGAMNGALTLFMLMQRGTTGGSDCIVATASSSPSAGFEFNLSSGDRPSIYNDNDSNTTRAPSSAPNMTIADATDRWLCGFSRGSGETPRFHVKNLTDATAWLHGDGETTQTTNPDSAAGGKIEIARFDIPGVGQFDYNQTDVGLLVWWDGIEFSDAQVEDITDVLQTSALLTHAAGTPSSITEFISTTPVDLEGLVTWTNNGATLTGNAMSEWNFDGTGTEPIIYDDSGSGTIIASGTGDDEYLTGVTSPYEDQVLADSPNGYWRLHDLNDSSGNDLDLTSGGTVTSVASLLLGDPDNDAKQLETDFSVDRLYHANDALLQHGSAWTVEAWVESADIGFEYIAVSKFQEYQLGMDGSDHYIFYVYTTAGYYFAVSTTVVTVDTVHHVVGTWDGSDIRIYVDGVLEDTEATTGTTVTNTNSFQIGAYPGFENGWWGEIDEVAVYPSALSGSRIAAHYAVGIGEEPPTVYDDSGSGTVVASGTGTDEYEIAYDDTGTGTIIASGTGDDEYIPVFVGTVGPLVITLVDAAGNTVDGTVEVQLRAGGTVNSFIDEAGTTIAEFPFDSTDGVAELWLEIGQYEWRATVGSATTPWRPVDVPGVS